MPFFARTRELDLLDKAHAKPGARLFLLYGRRRVGKTELLKHWIQTRKHSAIYWQAELFPSTLQLASFSQAIRKHRIPGQPIHDDFTFGTWAQAFLEIGEISKSSR